MAVILDGRIVSDDAAVGGVNLAQRFVAQLTSSTPAPGANTATVSLQILDEDGLPVNAETLFELNVYSDANKALPNANATLGGATIGTIAAGTGTPAIKAKTSAAGLFSCTLTNLIDETVHLACDSTAGGPDLDCRISASVTFTP